MRNIKIEVSEVLKNKLAQEGVEELAAKDNWLTYINFCLHNYQNEELMREVYAIKRRLMTLKKIPEKMEVEVIEELKLLHEWQTENPVNKLSRISCDHLFFKQRGFLTAKKEVERNMQDKNSIWSLWMRFANLLNEKLVSSGELAIIDKARLEEVSFECASMIFDHPQQLMADLKNLTHIQNEILDAAESIAYLGTNSAMIYRQELKRVFDEVREEKTKIVTSLKKIELSIFEGNTQNIANQIKEKVDGVFYVSSDLSTKRWGEKELSIIQELQRVSEKVFPPKIMSGKVYSVKDYIDITRTVSPQAGLSFNKGKPLEIEIIPDSKPQFFRPGKNAIFELFSNANAMELNSAYQDLQALYALSLNNQKNNLNDEIIRELQIYSNNFRKRLDLHKAEVEQKIKKLNANFITRLISAKECAQLENWLVRLIRCSYQAEGIIQSIALSGMVVTETFEIGENVEQEAKITEMKNRELANETERLMKSSAELNTVFSDVVGVDLQNKNRRNRKLEVEGKQEKDEKISIEKVDIEREKLSQALLSNAPILNIEKKQGALSIHQNAFLASSQLTGSPIKSPPKPPKKTTIILDSNSPGSKPDIKNQEENETRKVTKNISEKDLHHTKPSDDNFCISEKSEERSVRIAMEECTQSEKINQDLFSESEKLNKNFVALQQKSKDLLGTSDSKAIKKDSITLQIPKRAEHNLHSGIFLGKEAQMRMQGNPMSKEFSKTLASVCVAHGSGMRLKQNKLLSQTDKKADEHSSEKKLHDNFPSITPLRSI
jgi:hypothetical protein